MKSIASVVVTLLASTSTWAHPGLHHTHGFLEEHLLTALAVAALAAGFIVVARRGNNRDTSSR